MVKERYIALLKGALIGIFLAQLGWGLDDINFWIGAIVLNILVNL